MAILLKFCFKMFLWLIVSFCISPMIISIILYHNQIKLGLKQFKSWCNCSLYRSIFHNHLPSFLLILYLQIHGTFSCWCYSSFIPRLGWNGTRICQAWRLLFILWISYVLGSKKSKENVKDSKLIAFQFFLLKEKEKVKVDQFLQLKYSKCRKF